MPPLLGTPDDPEPHSKEAPTARSSPRCQAALGAPSPRPGDEGLAPPPGGGSSAPFDELLVRLADAHWQQVQGLELELAQARGLPEPPCLAGPHGPARQQCGPQGAGPGEPELPSVPGAVCAEGGRPNSPGGGGPGAGFGGAGPPAAAAAPGLCRVRPCEEGREASKASKASRAEEWAEAVAAAKAPSTSLSSAGHSRALEERRRRRWAYGLVKSVYFNSLTYFLIIANSVFIGLTVQRQLYCAMHELEIEPAYDAVEVVFLCWFSVELFLKILAEDLYVFVGPDRMWNFLDLFLVVTSLLQILVERAATNTSAIPSLSLTRNVRLFRITRILRIIRVVRVCQSLRVMIFAILRSLDALVWVFAVLFFFKYMFAMGFMYAIASDFDEHSETCTLSACLLSAGSDCTATCERFTWFEANFGTLLRVMVTLFQSITGGLDWGEVYTYLSEIHYFVGAAYILFIYFMVFLVMNVVVGTVVNVTSEVSKRDRDSVVSEEMVRLKQYASDIKGFFEMADIDGSGQLSYDEFVKYLQEDQVKAYFRALDLDSRQVHTLFTLLDCNDSGEVGYSEFLEGCLRLKGAASSLDMNLVIYQLEHLLQRIQALTPQAAQASPLPPPRRLSEKKLSEVLRMRSQGSS